MLMRRVRGSNQIRPTPHSMIPCVPDRSTTDLEETLLEWLVVDRTEGSHRLGRDRNLNCLVLLTDDSRRAPVLLDPLPPILVQHRFPASLLGDVLHDELQALGKGTLGILKRVSVGDVIKRGRVTDKRSSEDVFEGQKPVHHVSSREEIRSVSIR